MARRDTNFLDLDQAASGIVPPVPNRPDFAQIPLFQGLSVALQERLSAIAGERTFTRGQVIFAEGDPAAGLHVVLQGQVKVYKLSADGKEQILHIWGPGEPFGEVAMFAGGTFPAYAEALTDCRTIYVPRAGLVDLLRSEPDLALIWLGILSARLRRFADLIETLTLKDVPARLAAYLLLWSDRAPTAAMRELDLPKGQLANLLAATPETLSRVLARMAAEQLIEVAGARGLRILDRAGLEALALGARRLSG